MMRALWTAATGMSSQQTNVDTISNNIANINTTGYKKETAEFKSLYYQTIQETQSDSEGNQKPVAAQVGLGVRNSAITSRFEQGALTETGNYLDLAVSGSGFFAVQLNDGSIAYTRTGAFNASVTANGTTICDADGNPLLDVDGNPIEIPEGMSMSKMSVDSSGVISFPDASGNYQSTGIKIAMYQFANPAGLEKLGNSNYKESSVSGAAQLESESDALSISTIRQGYLESSNVQAVDEMVNLIVAQRAYEMNSKIITAADTMMQQANNLRG
ncbi:MAG: flagellar basal-body rod protein FlgG [bacterium]|nr:flagellar basal-body rod protein FlgG [bacterium]